MDSNKRMRLEAAGFTVGDAPSFLGLSDAEMALVDMKVALARELRARRDRAAISQAAFARSIGSSQSRVAKMEAADASVSLDLLVRAVLATGAPRRAIAEAIAPARRQHRKRAGSSTRAAAAERRRR